MYPTQNAAHSSTVFGLKGKAILGLGGLLLLALVATGGTAYWQSAQLAEKGALQLTLGKVNAAGSRIETTVAESRNALMVMRNMSSVQAILRARDAGGIDPLSGYKLGLWAQRLQTMFSSFMGQMPQIEQLRYLDKQGNEIVRMEATGGQIRGIPASALQNKADKKWFSKTMQLNNGKVYFSSLNLNRKQGKIRKPHTPVLRIATPVFDSNGNRHGILVANLSAQQLFKGLGNGKNGISYYVINQQGYFVHHPNADRAFAFDRGFDYTVRDEFPQLAKLLQGQTEHVDYFLGDGKLEAFHRLLFDAQYRKSFLTLIAVIPSAMVFNDVRNSFTPVLLSMLAIILLSLLLITWLVSRYIVSPVIHLAAAAEKMVAGDLSTRLSEHEVRDEFRMLYRSFNAVAESQQYATERLQQQVDAKTIHLRSVVDNLVDGLITIDKHGSVQSFNTAAERIFGYLPDEVIGNNVKMLMPEPYRSEHDAYLQHYHDTGEERVIGIGREVAGRRKDGKTFPMDLSVGPVPLADGAIYVGLVRDISRRKQNERALHAAMQAAESSNRMKSEFLANMSHELRTPLNAIIGYSELLSEEAEDKGDTQSIADLNRIHSAGNHLLSLINDVLDLAKIEAGRVELMPEQVDVQALARDVITVAQPLFDKNGNRFTLDCADDIGVAVLDAGRVRQILLNLLSNAAKFTKQGTLSMTVSRHEEMLRFAVSDNGIGMSPAQLEKVFIPFVQADASTTREYGGTGLGLPISEEMCALMGGKIEAASEFGKGSTFTLFLPADVSAVVARVQASDIAAEINHDIYCSGAGMHAGEYVLIIDDDQQDRDMLTRYLEKAGFGVTAVGSGERGLALALEKAPLAILLDVLMPAMNGWQVLEALKKNPLTAGIPVVMISVVDKQNKASSLGAVEYLRKPLDKNQLLATMDNLMPETKQADVLVIEDDKTTRELVCRQLTSVGWQTRQACQGKEGLAQINMRMPNLILLDLIMPEMDGFAFLTALRKLPTGRNTPVVVLTAKDLTVKEQQFLLSATQQVISKGADGSGLDQLLQNVRHQIMLSRDTARARVTPTGGGDEENSAG